ncbi:MAG TPA: antitoxin Xre-like helix-turn-helix domain-containing protein [Candidatus Sulfotelmatobacter sp.]|nr:antitoxin Xre-like helix-turn-helix domain-containing protein [Candidatus Sulfotelmatobacter sp.]
MNALAAVPDLGLDLRKLPDLADPATRARLSTPAIEAFFAIVDKWQLRNEDAMTLLGGTSHGRYFELKRNRKGLLSQDELTRISLLIGIFKALNILFGQRLANQWTSRPNSNPMFNGAAPLQYLSRGGVPAMIGVRRLLDSRRGGR